MILPDSWAGVLEPCRPVFARRGTFVLFTVLATGMVAATGRRSVVGMLVGARMAQQISFHAACRFFSCAVWDIDRLGLIVARLIVTRLLGPGEPVTVVIDDTLFKRWGRHVWHAFWTHDGAAQGGKKIARGNRWVVAGIVVRLPLCTAPVCLPVLLRLWAGKGSTTPVELAAQLLGRTGAPCQERSWWVSPARPPHPACDSHRTGRSTCLASGSAVGGGCRVRCPWGWDPAAAVAVAGDRDAGCAGEGDPVVGDPPSDVAEATSEFFHPEPVLARVLGPYPPHQPTPRVVVDRTEHVLGHPVPEVGRPPDQGLVETDDQLVQILVPG